MTQPHAAATGWTALAATVSKHGGCLTYRAVSVTVPSTQHPDWRDQTVATAAARHLIEVRLEVGSEFAAAIRRAFTSPAFQASPASTTVHKEGYRVRGKRFGSDAFELEATTERRADDHRERIIVGARGAVGAVAGALLAELFSHRLVEPTPIDPNAAKQVISHAHDLFGRFGDRGSPLTGNLIGLHPPDALVYVELHADPPAADR